MTNQELSKWLAIHVMGWEFEYCDENIPCARIVNKDNCSAWFEWNPTENIKQAFMIVEKMESKPFFLRLSNFCSTGEWQWKAQFCSDSRDLYFDKVANIPALAICLAAKEAMEGGCEE